MNITRVYYNSSGDTLRIDTIGIEILPPLGKNLRVGNDPGLQMRLGPQTVQSKTVVSSVSLAAGRLVASIEIVGDVDAIDDTGPPYNITWAYKDLGSGQRVMFNMSNLPVIGDAL